MIQLLEASVWKLPTDIITRLKWDQSSYLQRTQARETMRIALRYFQQVSKWHGDTTTIPAGLTRFVVGRWSKYRELGLCSTIRRL